MKNIDIELITSLKQTLDEIEPMAKAGDDDAVVKWAMGKALYNYMASGNKITDLEWFKYTTYYTGNTHQELKKAA